MIKRCKNCHHDRMKVWGIDMMECQTCHHITTAAGLLLPPESQHFVWVVEQCQYPDDGPIVMETMIAKSGRGEQEEIARKYNWGRFGQRRMARLQYIEGWK